MKLVMDEKLKHRLVGLAVILSLGAIFAPAVMKKSSQHVDGNFSVNVKLPPKPLAPDVVLTDEKEVFKTIKVAKVEIPSVSEKRQLTELVKAEPVKSDLINANPKPDVKVAANSNAAPVHLAVNEAANNTAKKIIKVANPQPAKPPVAVALKQKAVTKVVPVTKVAQANNKPSIRKDIYAVQLASFSQLANAQTLVNKLHSKGYKANFIRTKGKQGPVYKVYVGHSPRKTDVMKLKTQLASAMQLNGFVVNTGVS
ncbi:SPOR domain-containing protein [Legionella maioricensis]|uniref:SPOR domain-containing protein n=1 Tax=Legionella maioricensis TaxID=2896528 RepID=A0A9X2D206_9GAMM|nr:SPOR domain-containing protein [Legionella maioricensis]MCL9684630.1 SPOR domain-containing protein [Legionella maioricensis]MCL9687410.1 SPOR domain-containing protein [Legionella maioricensis]